MRRILLLASILVIVSSGVALPAVRADTGLGAGLVYRPDTNTWPVTLSWSYQLWQGEWAATADGLVSLNGYYGIGVTIPLSAPGEALGKLCGLRWTDSCQQVLANTQAGVALLTDKPDLKAARPFAYFKWTAFRF